MMAGAGPSIAPEVAAALADGRAVVALESTIIAHGLPFPDNLEIARALESAVKDSGAVPATIAIFEGLACVGLSDERLQRVAREGAEFKKAGCTDLGVVMATGGSAATTVSGTCAIAARVGIRVMATGGIGGVHRGDAADVSVDLRALSELPIAVVSSGAKAILDLPRTLEALESLGVLVIGFGTSRFPAFYTRDSGLSLEHRIDDVTTLAAVLRTRFFELSQGGVLVANPVDASAELPRARIEPIIDAALAGAAAAGVVGKAVTPFVLRFIAEHTAGDAVRANRVLALGNAALAGRLAVALAAAR